MINPTLTKGRVRDSGFQTRPLEKSFCLKTLWRVGTGRDGFYDVPPYTRAHEVKLLTCPYPSLASLKRLGLDCCATAARLLHRNHCTEADCCGSGANG